MLVSQYNNFVFSTNQYKNKSRPERRSIALYGLIGEIGSLLSAVKKKLLAEDGEQTWGECNNEIIEEIGDVIWYCFSLAQIENEDHQVNILTHDIALLKREIGGENERARKIHAALDISKKESFLGAAERFPATQNMRLSDYQSLAFLTARTEGQDLLRVCLAVLWQLGAELLRTTLPEIELTLNKNVADRPVNTVLGEIAWHLAAIASIYRVSLDKIAERNIEKVSYRSDRSQRTPLHDDEEPEAEQLPRLFDVSFVSLDGKRIRMYVGGRRLGDELTDNSYNDDGYRFHDVMHLANAAHLGWSPVLRKLLRRKRKSDRKKDEVEDGARAQIVEELVLKAIHSEGASLSNSIESSPRVELSRNFTSRGSITFRLLKSLRQFVNGLEVEKNKSWEWEDAIFEGADVFFKLRSEEQGTVTVDLERRRLSFSPDVYIGLKGSVEGFGSGSALLSVSTEDALNVLTDRDQMNALQIGTPDAVVRMVAAKGAILDALAFKSPADAIYKMLSIKLLDGGGVCVKASGAVLQAMRARCILEFKLTCTPTPTALICTAIGVADFQDLAE